MQGLATAEARCTAAGLNLTPPRRMALQVLTSQHRAFGAYEVLEVLAANGLGSQPPAAYRALDFLTSNGLAHRIERLNAYVACPQPGIEHSPAFLICRSCQTVAEAPLAATRAALGETASTTGFHVEGIVVEAVGLCPACRPTPADPSPSVDPHACLDPGADIARVSMSGTVCVDGCTPAATAAAPQADLTRAVAATGDAGSDRASARAADGQAGAFAAADAAPAGLPPAGGTPAGVTPASLTDKAPGAGAAASSGDEARPAK